MFPYFDRTTTLLGLNNMRLLNEKHVLIVGLGGVGAYAAEMLCRAGIGKLTIVDFDIVQPTNMNRQLIALHSTIGKPKAVLLTERLKDINPQAVVVSLQEFLKEERITELLEPIRYDFVVDAIDTIRPKVFLICQCLSKKIPIISSMGAGGKLDISQIGITDISKTYECGLAKAVRKRLRDKGITHGLPVVFSPEKIKKESVIRLHEQTNQMSTIGTISYLPATFGCYLASYVIQNLISKIKE